MASSNTALRVTELDFDGIKRNLKQFLRERSHFTDYDYEGSNWQAVLDILAYNTHYMGYYVNAVANEMFLDTAQLRDSVLSHSKVLGYIPTSMRAATAIVDIDVTPGAGEDADAQTLFMPRYTRFISQNDDGSAYLWASLDSYSTIKANGRFSFANVELKQGDIITTQQLFDSSINSLRRFNIPSANVDTSTLLVTVQQSLTNTAYTIYTEGDDITEANANSTIYYLEENPETNGSYSITFGDNYLGKQPPNGAIIIMTYLETLGVNGNAVGDFFLLDDINGYSSNVSIETVSASAGGSAKEALETVRFRAPLYYTTQNRSVTTKDFESLIPRDYPNIQSISVWGGQDNDPPIYGKVFLSILPRDGYYLTREEKERIVDNIIRQRSVVTVTPEIVDPEMLYIKLNLIVRFDSKLTTLTRTELKELIRTSIIDYKDRELSTFSGVFRSSALLREIDNVDPSIRSSEMEVRVQKRLVVTANTTQNYVVDFGIPLTPGGIFDRIETYPATVITDTEEINRECFFEEQANTLTGITSVTMRSGGSRYKTAPTVTITGDGLGAEATSKIVNGSVKSVTVTNPGTGYTQASVSFSGGKGDGASAIATSQANRATLYSFYYGLNGQKTIVSTDAGSILYDTGKVYLNQFAPITLLENDYYAEDELSIVAYPKSTVIRSVRNQIVTIDEDDASSIVIDMIEED